MRMMYKDFYRWLPALVLLLLASPVSAWGPEGHRLVGQAAFERLGPDARAAVIDILGVDDAAAAGPALDRACNWPDAVRPTPEWAWTSPFHYINLPRHDTAYDRERDCPDGLCVTEGVLRYASELSHPQPDPERRWQALAFLCHLVGDLHQPLHAGFRDDRGANRVEIEYRGENWNLHEWWDGVLIRARLGNEAGRLAQLSAAVRALPREDWDPADVARWTEESHALAIGAAYPDGPVIDEDFADRSWAFAWRQWVRAADRLARILDAVLGEPREDEGRATG